MSNSAVSSGAKGANFHGISLGIPVMLMLLLGMMTLRIPPVMLDAVFTFNIALALVILLVSLYSLKPLDFAAFPSVLLVATLLRLALNVASTRVVLLEGHNGGDSAGLVIQAFGDVVVGGNSVVGLVVFVVLVIINFVVVTKGAGRISEVSARFTLDAMPGKQMAIDADLNAGLIDQDQARERRELVSQEADFYGSMDGASKFVKGDAVAGVLIMLINIIGGFAIGMAQHDLSANQAIQYYTLLTIGDGLAAQIPSLLLSTAAAIMVTRINSEHDVGQQIVEQMFTDPRALFVAAVIMGVMGVVPGMPHVIFLLLALLAGGAAYMQFQKLNKEEQQQDLVDTEPEPDESQIDVSWDDVLPVDVLGLEVGYRLIALVDRAQDGELLSRIKGVRKKLSQELGFLVPTVHIRDNLDLSPTFYRITLTGVTVGEAEVHPDKWLAIDPGEVFGKVEGIATKDPAFGLDALWINESEKDHAQTLGYTVVDPSTVIATHLNKLMQEHAAELLGHDEVQQLLDLLAENSPKLAEQLVPNAVSLPVLLKVMQNLLTEKVPVRDIRTIAEVVIDASAVGTEAEYLTAIVRVALGRLIVQTIYGQIESLDVITLEPELEQMLIQAWQKGSNEAVVIEPGLAERLQASIVSSAERQEISGKPAVVLVAGSIRAQLAKFVRFSQQPVHVVCYEEIPENRQITVVATIGRS
ncbi:MAG: flagellar biosynthesis protein FlhA [Pseudomonadales bacterium]|nr:flagellar biosynthesis protein FlhA [Pseudomonadales bacterium]